MRILIANDDGYLAPGLAALVHAMQGLGQIDVIAPEQNASGTSNALTLNRPLTVHRASNGFRYINGTPSDSVHVALTGLLPERPDLVLSGINNGANMGDDTLYSGTVAAAMEGFLFGIPAIAFSRSVNQNPIRRYEQRPTPSQPTNMSSRLSPSTSVSIAKVKRFRYAKYR